MEQVTIKVSTKGIDEPFLVNVERGQTIEELKSQGYTEEDIVSHVVRDENSNVGNASRAALAAAVEEGITDRTALDKVVQDAAGRYESGERAVRTRGGAASLLGKAIKWATTTAEMTKAYTDAIVSDGLEAANKVVVELYNEAHPAKEKAAK